MAKGVNPGKDWCEMSKIVAHEESQIVSFKVSRQNRECNVHVICFRRQFAVFRATLVFQKQKAFG